MHLVQFYQTTITDREPPHRALHFIVVPRRSLIDPTLLNSENAAVEAMRIFDVEPHCSIDRERLAHGLTAVLEIQNRQDERINDLDSLVASVPETFEFARTIAFEQFIPFEKSPIEGKTLADITKTGSPTAIGAALGFAAVGPGTLLLFITVPAGIVICYAAVAAGKWVASKIEPPTVGATQ